MCLVRFTPRYRTPQSQLAVSTASGEEDVRAKVHLKENDVKTLIDPGNHIYGHPFGISEDDFIKSEGAPTGYLKVSRSTAVMIYGKSHAFVFTDGKLSGLRIASQVFDWRIANNLPADTVHTAENWTLSNGLHADMTIAEVKKLLGERLIENDYRTYFDVGGRRVELDFVTYTSGDRSGERRICGIYLGKKND